MIILQLTNTRMSGTDADVCPIVSDARALTEAGHDITLITPAEATASLVDRLPRFVAAALRPILAAVSGESDHPAPTAPTPELVHVHHPFLVGEEALRIAALHNAPLVFTATLRYENPFPLPAPEAAHLRTFIEKLGICFANRCDVVVAHDAATAVRLFEGGVTRPIHVVATCHPPEVRARRLIEIYEEARAKRLSRGPLRECGAADRLRRELVLAWNKVHPTASSPTRRFGGVFAGLRGGSALPC
jgi:hypothetical protein